MAESLILKQGGGVGSDELTATVAQILSGYTAVTKDSDDEIGTGTMPNRGAVSQALNAGDSYTVPQGYHNGSGKITANSLASQTPANAVASNLTSGKTAWVNGKLVTGNGGDNQTFYNNGYNAAKIQVFTYNIVNTLNPSNPGDVPTDGTLSFDLKSIPGYQNLQHGVNFFAEVDRTVAKRDSYAWSYTYQYVASTGILNISYRGCAPFSINVFVVTKVLG